jgi:small subunit ribosomal protein S13
MNIKKNLVNTYGIGEKTAKIFYKKIGLNNRNNFFFLKKKQNNLLDRLTKSKIVEKKLKIEIKNIILFQQKIKTYRGIRNKLRYPCRGQRTHTNANTKKRIKI